MKVLHIPAVLVQSDQNIMKPILLACFPHGKYKVFVHCMWLHSYSNVKSAAGCMTLGYPLAV